MLLTIAFTASCKKLVSVDPPLTRTTGDAVFENVESSIAVLAGIYSNMSSPNLSSATSGITLVTKMASLSADELKLYSNAKLVDRIFYENNLSVNPQTSYGREFWVSSYPLIASCNTAIEGLNNSINLPAAIKRQLLGEAKFIRSFLYFYLINLYGDVPLVITSDFNTNRLLPRTSRDNVYQFLIKELKECQSLLSDKYLDGKLQEYNGSTERLRPTKWAATALLGRVYLYNGSFSDSENEATTLINNLSLFELVDLGQVFLKNNKEAVWQLQPVNKSGDFFRNTMDGLFFNLSFPPTGLNSTHPAHMSMQLIDAFEDNDNRKNVWVGTYTDGTGDYHFSKKYNSNLGTSDVNTIVEYLNIFRLAEQYLIRAEARAHLGDPTGAVSDLNTIRLRAGLTVYNGSTTQGPLLSAILHERQTELFNEWGHRWFDLKRTKHVDEVMNVVTPIKSNGKPWKSTQQYYPIPLTEIQRNPNLKQNEGYN